MRSLFTFVLLISSTGFVKSHYVVVTKLYYSVKKEYIYTL